MMRVTFTAPPATAGSLRAVKERNMPLPLRLTRLWAAFAGPAHAGRELAPVTNVSR
jgi:hypothetical protein